MFVEPRQTHESMTWIRKPPDNAQHGELSWYIDASQIDTDGEAAAVRFGVGAVAVNDNGDLIAALRAVPPAFIDSIPAAEAWALWLVLSETPARKRVHGLLGQCEDSQGR